MDMFFKILIQIITIYKNDTVQSTILNFLTEEQNNSGLFLMVILLLTLALTVDEILLPIQRVR